jgi:hypothetical protein
VTRLELPKFVGLPVIGSHSKSLVVSVRGVLTVPRWMIHFLTNCLSVGGIPQVEATQTVLTNCLGLIQILR